MQKIYIIPTPENLKEMQEFCKKGNVLGVATVWSAMRRKNGECSAWDNRIEAVFDSKTIRREAWIARPDKHGAKIKIAALKYSPALDYCREHFETYTLK